LRRPGAPANLAEEAGSSRAEPELAVVVLAYRCRPTLAAAVRSLLVQEVPAEVLVVHSGGGGDVAALLAAAGIDVPVVAVVERLFAGGARNLGIASTRAPYVAFLADDHVAEPGWVSERLASHRTGAPAVGCALVCHRPRSVVAQAGHLSLSFRRLPGIDPAEALPYGASYDRRLFERYGLFRDDLEGGEDTEFHQRLADADKPVWNPRVRTIHSGPETLGELLAGQYRRGRRMARAWRALGGPTRSQVARDAVARTWRIATRVRRAVAPHERLAATCAIPLIALGNLVYAAGALAAGPESTSP